MFREELKTRNTKRVAARVGDGHRNVESALAVAQGFHFELRHFFEDGGEAAEGDFDPDQDDLLGDAIATVVQMGTASTSMLQRRLRVGYTRAGRLIDMMERRGVISGYEGSKARQVLITEADLPRVLEALSEPVAAD